jgi:TolA-binding protein
MERKHLVMSRQSHTVLVLSLLFLTTSVANAQLTNELNSHERVWDKATDAFEKKQYALAMNVFEEYLDSSIDPNSDRHVEAEYTVAICALNLYHKDAEYRVDAFTERYPESIYVQDAFWAIADHHYKRRHFKKAAEAFNIVKLRQLPQAQQRELRYKRGHSLFEEERYEEARYDLFEVMKKPGAFLEHATYYFSHIAYINNNPQVALEGFQAIADHPDFAELVPVYIAQTMHATQQFSKLKSYGSALLENASGIKEEMRTEIARLVGDAFYKTQEFSLASTYLEVAWKGTRGPGRKPEFAYQVGYTRYRMSEWRGALDVLALTAREDNKLGQNATYHMADCYIQLGQKDKARNAFGRAASKDYDMEIMEDALFSYAKLAFELSYNPFDNAITAFTTYLEKYPNSVHHDEAYRFLLEVYLTSRDYDRALHALDQIKDKDPTVQASYQILSYNRGVELYQAGKYSKAIPYFVMVRKFPIDPLLAAESHYWEGEAYFAQKDYVSATKSYADFSRASGGYLSDYYPAADYARGYALFKRKMYLDALSAFRTYLDAYPEESARRFHDAELRTADCFYAKKEFNRAVDYYNRCFDRDAGNMDYILFQRGMANSLSEKEGSLEAQIVDLDKLLEEFPKSRFVVDALYESARTQIELDNLDDARRRIDVLLNSHPRNARTKEALVDLCLIGIKQNKPEEVLATWDKIRTTYGNDPVASDAYNIVEPLLIERGLLDNLPPAVGLTGQEIEQRLFKAAVNLAIEENYSKALPRLEEYLRQYENGTHLVEAHFYLAACLNDANDRSGALLAYEKVLAFPPSEFTEASALGAATLAWNTGDYPRALGHYRLLSEVSSLQANKLEASIGSMRCYYLLDQPEQAFSFANDVYTDPGTPESIKRTAALWLGRINYDADSLDVAFELFNSTVKFGGSVGAESQYMIAKIYYDKGKYGLSEQGVFTLVGDYSSYEDWKHKGFLLLVKSYIGLDDLFQARATAESIMENVDTHWVQDECSDLIMEIEELEAADLDTEDNE